MSKPRICKTPTEPSFSQDVERRDLSESKATRKPSADALNSEVRKEK